MPDTQTLEIDLSTEEKIKAAARAVFHQKGFAGTRTREIAEKADINLALLNYYFRSKEKLFRLIMTEDAQTFIQTVALSFNDEHTTLDEKIDLIVSDYINLLKEQPHIPLFVLSELRTNPERFLSTVGIKDMLVNSVFLKQFMELAMSGKMQPINPIHLIMNLMGMTIFPFISSPILKEIGGIEKSVFNQLMDERKELIPKWIKAMLYV